MLPNDTPGLSLAESPLDYCGISVVLLFAAVELFRFNSLIICTVSVIMLKRGQGHAKHGRRPLDMMRTCTHHA